jgi:hypothetical protein
MEAGVGVVAAPRQRRHRYFRVKLLLRVGLLRVGLLRVGLLRVGLLRAELLLHSCGDGEA